MDEVEEPQQPQPPSLLDHLAGAGDPEYDPDATAAHEPVDPQHEAVEYEPVEYDHDATVAHGAVEYEAVEYDQDATVAHEAVNPRYDYEPVEYKAGAEQEAEAEDDEDAEKRRVPLSTKVLLVGAGWVLLTFFLIGVFNKDGKDDSVRLSQAPGAASLDESGEDGGDGGDGSDASGDGVTDGDADATVEAYPGRTVAGGESGSAGSASADSGGTAGGGAAGGTGGTSGGGSGGGAGSGGATATTARSGGGGTGGSSSSTTAAPGRGGGSGSTSTTATTKPSGSTTTSTPAPAVVKINRGGNSDFESSSVTIVSGQAVRFENEDNAPHTLTFDGQDPTPILGKGTYTRTFTKDTVVRCSDPGNKGSILVNVA